MQVIEIVTNIKPGTDQLTVEIAIKRIESLVKEYCNRSDIPSTLNFLIADMVVDYLNLQDRAENPENYKEAVSIDEGDTSVKLGAVSTKTSENSLESILSDYKSRLNKHRKLRW